MDTVPISGLVRQQEECRLHILRAHCFPQASWAPSQPWPCGGPASDPFGHQAMLAAGVENIGSKSAKRDRCPAGPREGKAVTEGGEGWQCGGSRHTVAIPPPQHHHSLHCCS